MNKKEGANMKITDGINMAIGWAIGLIIVGVGIVAALTLLALIVSALR